MCVIYYFHGVRFQKFLCTLLLLLTVTEAGWESRPIRQRTQLKKLSRKLIKGLSNLRLTQRRSFQVAILLALNSLCAFLFFPHDSASKHSLVHEQEIYWNFDGKRTAWRRLMTEERVIDGNLASSNQEEGKKRKERKKERTELTLQGWKKRQAVKKSLADLVRRWSDPSCSLWFSSVQTHSRSITAPMKESRWDQAKTSWIS